MDSEECFELRLQQLTKDDLNEVGTLLHSRF
jgi:hypothetical protein